MKFTTTLIIAIFPLIALSQNETEISTSVITEVGKNAVSESITVHTYKLTNAIESQQSDTDIQQINSEEIQAMVNLFLAVDGIHRCTFDRATQSFTILSEPTTNVASAVELINQL